MSDTTSALKSHWRVPIGLACLLLAIFLFMQFLGLLFIERVADRAADAGGDVTVPLSVRLLGAAASHLHETVLDEPLVPDWASWPAGFRIFFILELCGLAGLTVAFTQIGMGVLKSRNRWIAQGGNLAGCSVLALIIGIGFLKLIR